jgi:hypothetical protein
MPTQLLPIGPPQLLVQNRVYALPAVSCNIFCSTPAAVVAASNDITFTESANPFVFTDGGLAKCSGTFLRTTTANTTITLKRQ